MSDLSKRDYLSKKQLQFKIAVLGDGGVGKTALLFRCIYDKFFPNTPMTKGVVLHSWQVKAQQYHDQITIGMKIWDFSGQELNHARLSGFIEGTRAAFLVFDLTAFHSLVDLREWRMALKEYAGDVPTVLVGTKYDQVQENTAIAIDDDTILEFCDELDAQSFIKTSAKTGYHTTHLFTPIIKAILNQSWVKEDSITIE
jgi:small GTP-binding protein